MVDIENGKLQTPDSFLKHTEMSLKSRTRGLVVNDLCIPHFRSVLTGELFRLFYGRFCVCVWPVQCVGRSRCARPAQRPRRAAPARHRRLRRFWGLWGLPGFSGFWGLWGLWGLWAFRGVWGLPGFLGSWVLWGLRGFSGFWGPRGFWGLWGLRGFSRFWGRAEPRRGLALPHLCWPAGLCLSLGLALRSL